MLETRDKSTRAGAQLLSLNANGAGASIGNQDAALFPPLRARHPTTTPRAKPKHHSKAPLGGRTKRVFDLIFSAAAIAALWPLMAMIALIVKLESPGPVLFAQRRGGYRGRPFLIYKFRSMTSCDDGRTIRQATEKDERVTRFGAFMRKTSLDELPQFFNVFSGDMSLIGPRPHALAHDEAFAQIAPTYHVRFRARPGITGLAQVSGSRGPTVSEDAILARVHLDAAYVKRWSLWLDLTIFVRTLLMFLVGHKAF
jgi:exopolysaccharide biosynthesis polyprenyl glycosylphosphotransferase